MGACSPIEDFLASAPRFGRALHGALAPRRPGLRAHDLPARTPDQTVAAIASWPGAGRAPAGRIVTRLVKIGLQPSRTPGGSDRASERQPGGSLPPCEIYFKERCLLQEVLRAAAGQ